MQHCCRQPHACCRMPLAPHTADHPTCAHNSAKLAAVIFLPGSLVGQDTPKMKATPAPSFAGDCIILQCSARRDLPQELAKFKQRAAPHDCCPDASQATDACSLASC